MLDETGDDADDAAPPAPPPGAGTRGQWVYTAQFGWIWPPAGDEFSEIPDYGMPYSYVYCPAYGWAWIVSPWYSGAWWPYRYFWADSYHPAGYTFAWSRSVYATYGGGSDYRGWSYYRDSDESRVSTGSARGGLMTFGGPGWSYSDGRPGSRRRSGSFSTYHDTTSTGDGPGQLERREYEAGSESGASIRGAGAGGGGWTDRGGSWRDGKSERVGRVAGGSTRRGGGTGGEPLPPARRQSEERTPSATSSHAGGFRGGGGGVSRGGKR